MEKYEGVKDMFEYGDEGYPADPEVWLKIIKETTPRIGKVIVGTTQPLDTNNEFYKLFMSQNNREN